MLPFPIQLPQPNQDYQVMTTSEWEQLNSLMLSIQEQNRHSLTKIKHLEEKNLFLERKIEQLLNEWQAEREINQQAISALMLRLERLEKHNAIQIE